jgi:hypothetical protein
MVRNCPSCGKLIEYKKNYSFNIACKNNTKCKTCTAISNSRKMHHDIAEGLRKNPFFGKSHSLETRKILSEKTSLAIKEGRLSTRGKKNGMYGKSLPSEKKGKTYIELYGEEKAAQLKDKISKKTSGKNNPMFGKPSPTGSGNGWSGYYSNYYFRSLLELSFIINIAERFKLDLKSAESIRIRYLNNDKDRNYIPDFIVNDKYLIEIKPKQLINSQNVILKRNAALEYCSKVNLIYKIMSPRIIEFSVFRELIESGRVKLIEKYYTKFKEYGDTYDRRSAARRQNLST